LQNIFYIPSSVQLSELPRPRHAVADAQALDAELFALQQRLQGARYVNEALKRESKRGRAPLLAPLLTSGRADRILDAELSQFDAITRGLSVDSSGFTAARIKAAATELAALRRESAALAATAKRSTMLAAAPEGASEAAFAVDKENFTSSASDAAKFAASLV
jgi:hypothetical protein